jgi:hypothetical protein
LRLFRFGLISAINMDAAMYPHFSTCRAAAKELAEALNL